jgi:hypothetical protein
MGCRSVAAEGRARFSGAIAARNSANTEPRLLNPTPHERERRTCKSCRMTDEQPKKGILPRFRLLFRIALFAGQN